MRRLGAAHPVHLVLGLTVWALWFVAVYGGLAVACKVAPPPPADGAFTVLNAGMLLVSVFTAAGLALAARACHRAWRAMPPDPTDPTGGRQRFIAGCAAALYGVAAVSTVFVALPLVAVAPCV